MYREKSTEFELQTLILLLDQSPSFSNSHFSWPQMKLTIPYHRAVRYMSWGCLWDTQQSVWRWQAPPGSPWISHRFIKGKFHLTAGCHFTIHKRQWNHFPENILQPKFHQTKQNKTKKPPLMRQKGWGNNTEGWSDLQQVLLVFLSPN